MHDTTHSFHPNRTNIKHSTSCYGTIPAFFNACIVLIHDFRRTPNINALLFCACEIHTQYSVHFLQLMTTFVRILFAASLFFSLEFTLAWNANYLYTNFAHNRWVECLEFYSKVFLETECLCICICTVTTTFFTMSPSFFLIHFLPPLVCLANSSKLTFPKNPYLLKCMRQLFEKDNLPFWQRYSNVSSISQCCH